MAEYRRGGCPPHSYLHYLYATHVKSLVARKLHPTCHVHIEAEYDATIYIVPENCAVMRVIMHQLFDTASTVQIQLDMASSPSTLGRGAVMATITGHLPL